MKFEKQINLLNSFKEKSKNIYSENKKYLVSTTNELSKKYKNLINNQGKNITILIQDSLEKKFIRDK